MIEGVLEKYSPDKVRRYVQALAGAAPDMIKVGSVKAVDAVTLTCDILPDNAPTDAIGLPLQLKNVDLGLNTSQVGFGLYLLPKVNSQVIYLEDSPFGPYCLAFAEVDTYFINASVNINGGTNGQMVNWLMLKAQLDKLNAQLYAVVNTLSTWIPVPNDGGAALKTAFAAAIAGHTAADFTGTNLTDPKVVH